MRVHRRNRYSDSHQAASFLMTTAAVRLTQSLRPHVHVFGLGTTLFTISNWCSPAVIRLSESGQFGRLLAINLLRDSSI